MTPSSFASSFLFVDSPTSTITTPSVLLRSTANADDDFAEKYRSTRLLFPGNMSAKRRRRRPTESPRHGKSSNKASTSARASAFLCSGEEDQSRIISTTRTATARKLLSSSTRPSNTSFITVNCNGFRNHTPLAQALYNSQPHCRIGDVPPTSQQIVLVAKDVDNLEDNGDGLGPQPKTHLLVSHVPPFDLTDPVGTVSVPKAHDTEVSSSDMKAQLMATMKFTSNMMKNLVNIMPGDPSEKELLWNETKHMNNQMKRKTHMDYLTSIPWRSVQPSREELLAGVRGIEDEYPHRLVFSAYALDRSFHDEIKARLVKNWTWTSLHNLIRKHVLERADTTAIVLRQRPADIDAKVYDYRNPDSSAVLMQSYKDAFSYSKKIG